jgi:outer membrane protein OmpA-like peptidoglycan-associated protein
MTMPWSINQIGTHDAVAALTKNEDTLYYTSSGGMQDRGIKRNNNNIFFATRISDTAWTKGKLVFEQFTPKKGSRSKEINIQHPALHPSGRVLVFSSDMAGGNGKLDLYRSTKQPDGRWSVPVNIGNKINTAGDEVFPSFDKSGNLYFASDGLVGMGGLDIFLAAAIPGSDSSWGLPENLRAPINSASDDFYIFWMPSGSLAYFSSDRAGGKGSDDIFSAKKRNTETLSVKLTYSELVHTRKNPQLILVKEKGKPVNLPFVDSSGRLSLTYPLAEPGKYILSGLVNDGLAYQLSDTVRAGDGYDSTYYREYRLHGIGLSGVVAERDLRTRLAGVSIILKPDFGDSLVVNTDSTGTFKILLRPGINYTIYARKAAYFSSAPLRIGVPVVNRDSTIEANIFLSKMLQKGERFVFRNIYFDYNKADITKSSEAELDKISNFLASHPDVEVEISAHTDTRGNDQFNMKLSQIRALAAVKYLISKGISAKRMQAKGYGEFQPINNCVNGRYCTEAEHAQNRRIEMKITKVMANSIK